MKNNSDFWKNILFLLFGVACLYFGYQAASAKSSSWPTTTGLVVSSDISIQGSSTDSSEREYYTDVVYSYTADGAGHQATVHSNWTSESDANKEAGAYVPGQEITVYYNPDDPGTSTLSPGEYKIYGYIGLITGVVLLGMGGWGLYSQSKKTAENSTANDSQG